MLTGSEAFLAKIPFKFYQFYSEESMIKDRFGHRTGDWTDQVRKGVQDLCVRLNGEMLGSD